MALSLSHKYSSNSLNNEVLTAMEAKLSKEIVRKTELEKYCRQLEDELKKAEKKRVEREQELERLIQLEINTYKALEVNYKKLEQEYNVVKEDIKRNQEGGKSSIKIGRKGTQSKS